MSEGYREFACVKDDKSVLLLSVRHPTKKELETADLEYSGVFNQSLLAGLPTQQKMLRSLRENGVISSNDEMEIAQLIEDIRLLESEIQKLQKQTPSEEQKEAHQKQIMELQAKRLPKAERVGKLNREIEAMLAHTADAKAAISQRNFLIACVVEHAEGPKKGDHVWADLDALTAEKDDSLISRVFYEHMQCQNNLPSDWDNLMKSMEKKEETKDSPETAKVVSDAVAGAAPEVVPPLVVST